MLGQRFIEKYRAGSLFVLYIFVSIVCIAFSSKTFVQGPKELGLSLFAVFQGGVSSVGGFVAETFNSVRVLRELKAEHASALERLQRYEQIEKDISILRDENTRLNEVLSFSAVSPFKNIPAKIIGKDPQNYHSTLVINRGSLSGIKKNMIVVGSRAGEQGLVGKIITVGLSSSMVQPVYDPNSFVAARLLSSRHEGLVNGSGEGTVRMRYVKRYARPEIRYGDIVVSSGMESSLYPGGIEIGTVKKITARSYDTSLELEIEPLIDFSRLEYVYVLLPDTEDDHDQGEL